jgi:hypothetical protein
MLFWHPYTMVLVFAFGKQFYGKMELTPFQGHETPVIKEAAYLSRGNFLRNDCAFYFPSSQPPTDYSVHQVHIKPLEPLPALREGDIAEASLVGRDPGVPIRP